MFRPNVVKRKQHKNYQDEDKTSAINKKINSLIIAFKLISFLTDIFSSPAQNMS